VRSVPVLQPRAGARVRASHELVLAELVQHLDMVNVSVKFSVARVGTHEVVGGVKLLGWPRVWRLGVRGEGGSVSVRVV